MQDLSIQLVYWRPHIPVKYMLDLASMFKTQQSQTIENLAGIREPWWELNTPENLAVN